MLSWACFGCMLCPKRNGDGKPSTRPSMPNAISSAIWSARAMFGLPSCARRISFISLRIENESLFCYDEFAFYINRGGRGSRKNFLVHWEGAPTSFAFQYLYALAFEPTFVGIRNVGTGSMSQVIQGNNVRLPTGLPAHIPQFAFGLVG
ncbi:CNH domain containing protein [Lactarius tabidus]